MRTSASRGEEHLRLSAAWADRCVVTTLPQAVAEAAQRGWKLFPCAVRGKLPLLKDWPGKASSDLTILQSWANEHPRCNWGIVTGTASGVVVIDVDGAEGRTSLAALEQQGFALPATLAVTTGRADGGTHLYFRMPAVSGIRNNQSGKIGAHIDFRGDGGFVIAAGSAHPTGKLYAYADPDADIAELPAWIVERLTERPTLAAKAGQPGAIGPGARTPLLVSLAGKLHSQGVPAEGIEAALSGLNGTFNPPHPPEKIRRIVDDLTRRYERGAMPEETRPDLVCLADVAPRAVEWLWEPFIPARMLSMLSGDPGTGKSFIALAVCADLSRGKLRDGRIVEPANSLYLSIENPLGESIRPRFDALGGDPARFFALRGTIVSDSGEEQRGAVTLADVAILDAAISETRAQLVIIDPIQSYMGAAVDVHRSNETRPIMDGLARLAESHGCSILLLRHLSKQSGGKAIHRGLGSIDLTGAVRSEMLAGSLPDDPDARALVHIKSNVGRMGRTLGYSIDGAGRFAWTGESSITAADLLAAPAGPGDHKLAEASQWLTELLKSGSREQREVRELAESAGISFATLRRAKDALRVRSYKASVRGPWLWALPDPPQDAQDAHEGAHTENVNPLGNLSAFQDAQKDEEAQCKSFRFPRGSKTVCEPLVEHLGDGSTKPNGRLAV